MATKQTRQKNSKSSMSLGSALLLILVVVLVRWYGGGSSAETTATQSAGSNGVVQVTLQPPAEKSAEIVAETPTAEERDSEATAEDNASPEVELVVATLPPVEPDTPTSIVAATATDAPEDAVAQASPTRAPPTAPPTDTPPPTAPPKATATPKATDTPRPRPTATPTQVQSLSGLPLVFYDELPPEAHDTIALIDSNGPFPFYKDGATFQNRERILPRRSNGYYREYTVITPWEDDRGARRIVAGAEGELYYTDDHYDSFREVVR